MLATLFGAADRRGARRLSRSGFTLVELLVTIAILGTLIGVSVPAVSLARQRVRKSQCQANLREIGMLFQMYLDIPRNYQTFPNACKLPSVNSQNLTPINIYLDNAVKFTKQSSKNAKGETEEKKIYHSGIQSLFHCPEDEDYFPVEKLSYEYNKRDLGGKKMAEVLRSPSGRRREPRYQWVMTEFDAFHGADDDSAYAQNRNWLYLDWHVDDGVPEAIEDRSGTSTDSSSTSTDSTTPPADSTTNPPSGSTTPQNTSS